MFNPAPAALSCAICRLLLAPGGLAWLDLQFGELRPAVAAPRRYWASPSTLAWAQLASQTMLRVYRQIRLPNNYPGNFWADYGPAVTSLVPKEKLRTLLVDFYPNGPRYAGE